MREKGNNGKRNEGDRGVKERQRDERKMKEVREKWDGKKRKMMGEILYV